MRRQQDLAGKATRAWGQRNIGTTYPIDNTLVTLKRSNTAGAAYTRCSERCHLCERLTNESISTKLTAFQQTFFRLVVLTLLLYMPLRLNVDPNLAPVCNTWVVINLIRRV